MDTSHSSDQTNHMATPEASTLSYLLERGVDCTRQGSFIEGATLFELAREQLTPDQM
jgi:hypothetical protein